MRVKSPSPRTPTKRTVSPPFALHPPPQVKLAPLQPSSPLVLSCLRTSTILCSVSRIFTSASACSSVFPLSIYQRTKRPRIRVPFHEFAEYSTFTTCISHAHPSRRRSWFESGLHWFSDRFASLDSLSSVLDLFSVATDGGRVASFNSNATNIIGASNAPGTILSHPSICSMIDWFRSLYVT
jgi:hypothetical protein